MGTHIAYSPEGPRLHIQNDDGLTYYGMSCDKKQHPLFGLADTVDGFHTRYGRAPKFCITGPEQAAALEPHRATWEAWGVTLVVRDRCAGVFQCGDQRPTGGVS